MIYGALSTPPAATFDIVTFSLSILIIWHIYIYIYICRARPTPPSLFMQYIYIYIYILSIYGAKVSAIRVFGYFGFAVGARGADTVA